VSGPADRRREAARMREEGKSLRAIAQRLDVSHVQVSKDLATVDELRTPDRITGLDGRSRPSTVKPTVNAPVARSWIPPEGAQCSMCDCEPVGPGGILCPDCRTDIENLNHRITRRKGKPPGDQPGGDGGDARPVGRSALSPGITESIPPEGA
jgi:hypothetical protein